MKFQDIFRKPAPEIWEEAFLKEAKIAGKVLPETENVEQLVQRCIYTQSENLSIQVKQPGWKIRQRIDIKEPNSLQLVENCLRNDVNIIEINDVTAIADIPTGICIGLYDTSLTQVLNAIEQFPKQNISWSDGFLPAILISGKWQEPNWDEIYTYIQAHQKVLPVTLSPIRNGGATVVHETTAIYLALDYITRELANRNIPAGVLAQRLLLRLATGPHLMSEVAKYRATRVLWDQFWYRHGVQEAAPAYIIAETTTWNSSPADPPTDLLRATGAAFASIAGTVNELLVSPCSKSEAYPAEFGLRMARNIQHILREEAYLAATIDPAAGAYYPERLSQQIVYQTNSSIQALNSKGDFKTLLLNNELTPLYAARKERMLRDYREKKDTLIGVTHYLNPNIAKNSAAPEKQAAISSDFKPVDQTPIAFWL